MGKVIIEQEYINPCFPPKFSFIPKKNKKVEKPKKERFKIGRRYLLSGVECDDFEMPKKEYELVGLVSEINGIVLDSVIMKQISGTSGTIFSLTKQDCRNLNIKFQPCLQMFPRNLNWIEVKDETEKVENIDNKIEQLQYVFNPNNLSTYPLCHVDKTVRHIMIEINSCSFNHISNFISIGDEHHIHKTKFLENLKIRVKRPLLGDNTRSANYQYGDIINYRLMTREVGNCTTNEFVDNEGKIYIELSLVKHNKTRSLFDGYIGVKHQIFDNQSFSDIFELYYIKNDMNNNQRNLRRNKYVPSVDMSLDEMRRAMMEMKNIFPEYKHFIYGIGNRTVSNVDGTLKRLVDDLNNVTTKSHSFIYPPF